MILSAPLAREKRGPKLISYRASPGVELIWFRSRHLCLTPVTDPSTGPFKSLLRDHFSGAYARGSGFCTFWNVLQDGSLLASVQQKTCKGLQTQVHNTRIKSHTFLFQVRIV